MGVDVGANGAIAVISGDGAFVEAHLIPESRKDVSDLIMEFAPNTSMAYVEKVRSSPQMGIVSAFTFGCNYERMIMALICHNVPIEEVRPQVWQKALAIPPCGDKTRTEHKRLLKEKAQMLFPNLKITLATADALLIAEFCRRTRVVV